MRTFPAQTLRRDELRRDTRLEAVIESFFVHQSIKPKTEEFYRTHFRSFVNYLAETLGREPVLEDVDSDYAAMFLKKLEREPTAKYPTGSPFRARPMTRPIPIPPAISQHSRSAASPKPGVWP